MHVALYRDHLLPRLVDRACALPGIETWRARVVEGLAGRVVEIGFGSGLNAPHYPEDIDVVLAVEPIAAAARLARPRVAARAVRVEHVGTDGQCLPIDDESCDAALSTFTLCTVGDPAAALAEISRVLRPGAALHFLEHGVAPDPHVVRWQRRLEPLQRRLGGGCHLTRDPVALVTRAGFGIERCEQAYATGPKPWSYFTMGVATTPR